MPTDYADKPVVRLRSMLGLTWQEFTDRFPMLNRPASAEVVLMHLAQRRYTVEDVLSGEYLKHTG